MVAGFLAAIFVLLQATVSPDSALIGHTVRQMRFRTYYEGVVLAIHRQVRRPVRCNYVETTGISSVPCHRNLLCVQKGCLCTLRHDHTLFCASRPWLQSGYVSLLDVCDVDLRAGDVLLLEADQTFKKRFQSNPAFGLVSV
jgi:hypothetical protein